MLYAVCYMLYAVCSIQYTVYSMQYTVCSIQYAEYSMQYAVYSIQYALVDSHMPYSQNCMLYASASDTGAGKGAFLRRLLHNPHNPLLLCYVPLFPSYRVIGY
jgi:hypothetical protein